jgi:hypothetical protein
MEAPPVTEAQLELLRDKYVLYDRASREGPMDMRDYNRRAAEALKALLSEREDATNALVWIVSAWPGWRDAAARASEALADRTNRMERG